MYHGVVECVPFLKFSLQGIFLEVVIFLEISGVNLTYSVTKEFLLVLISQEFLLVLISYGMNF